MHTGDIASMDDAGYVNLVDRTTDLIITGGHTVHPAEIERVMTGHPAVAMIAVGPVPTAIRDEPARGEIDPTRGQLAAYERPRLVGFVEDLPKPRPEGRATQARRDPGG